MGLYSNADKGIKKDEEEEMNRNFRSFVVALVARVKSLWSRFIIRIKVIAKRMQAFLATTIVAILETIEKTIKKFAPRYTSVDSISEHKIVIENHPAPEDLCILRFHLTEEISNSEVEWFKRPLRPSSEQYLTAVGERGANLIRQLFQLRGITEVYIDPYGFDTHIGKAFDKEERKKKIINIVKNLFPNPKKVIVTDHT